MTSLTTPADKPSVVVRTKNEAARVEAALRSLRSQSVDVEIVLVDSGSTDGTVELAKPFCDEIVKIRPEQFTFGRSLNMGAQRASGTIVFALSAHCVAPNREWVANHLIHYRDTRVAGVFGVELGPSGVPLDGPWTAGLADVGLNPHWGYSNHASSWRRSVWEKIPFDESMRSCEDKQWMWRALLASYVVIADPAVIVSSNHRRQAGLRALWRREVSEHEALAQALDYSVPSARETLATWWSFFPWASQRATWQRRLSPWRTIEIAGGYFGERAGAARRDGATLRLDT
jgi:rhamnosyltransferase